MNRLISNLLTSPDEASMLKLGLNENVLGHFRIGENVHSKIDDDDAGPLSSSHKGPI